MLERLEEGGPATAPPALPPLSDAPEPVPLAAMARERLPQEDPPDTLPLFEADPAEGRVEMQPNGGAASEEDPQESPSADPEPAVLAASPGEPQEMPAPPKEVADLNPPPQTPPPARPAAPFAGAQPPIVLRPPQIAFSTATRLPVEHARMLLPSRLSGATQFKRGPSPAAPSPLAPGTLPRLGSDGVFRRDPSPKPPPATAKALQRWPAPTSTYNTFP